MVYVFPAKIGTADLDFYKTLFGVMPSSLPAISGDGTAGKNVETVVYMGVFLPMDMALQYQFQIVVFQQSYYFVPIAHITTAGLPMELPIGTNYGEMGSDDYGDLGVYLLEMLGQPP